MFMAMKRKGLRSEGLGDSGPEGGVEWAGGGRSDRTTRPPILRLQRLKALISEGGFPNCRTLAGALEVSSKTIQRDLQFMQNELGLPLEYDAERHGYHFTGAVVWNGSVDVTEGELVAILVAQKALQQYRGTVFEKPLLSACRKIEESMGGLISVNWSDLDGAFSFKETGALEMDAEVFERVGRAVREGWELEFEYQKLGSTSGERRRVHPYHLGCVNGQWYVFGPDPDRGQMRTFALSRLRSPALGRVRFQRAADFSIEEYLKDSLDVFRSSGPAEEVRVRFDAWGAGLVRGRKWHESQRLTEREDGGVELELQLSGFEEVERWVLGFGGRAWAVHPPALVERLRGTLERMRERYEGRE
jgi:predicted DNA-binding transcriptional regulator YafY